MASASTSTPIKIAGADERSSWSGGRFAYISGWGSLHNTIGPFPDSVNSARTFIQTDTTCRSAWGLQYDPTIMVCAGDWDGNPNACSGDSGGPLVVPTAGPDVRLVGVTDFVSKAGCDVAHRPAVFARIADDPIRTVIQNSVLSITGIDVVGSGAQVPTSLPPGPTPPLPDAEVFSKRDAIGLTAGYSKSYCDHHHACWRWWAGACSPTDQGYYCSAINYDRTRYGRRYTCVRGVTWILAPPGQGVEPPLFDGRWRCHWPR